MNPINMFNNPDYKQMKFEQDIFAFSEFPSGYLKNAENNIPINFVAKDKTLDNKGKNIFSAFLSKIGEEDNVEKGVNSYIKATESSANKNLKDHLIAYADAYGIPENGIDYKERSLNIITDTLQTIVVTISEYTNGTGQQIRLRLATALQKQEDQILSNATPTILSDPVSLRSYLIDELENKNLSYESAINQFMEPDKAIEGSYVLCKLIAQCDAWSALQSKSKDLKIPFDAVWRASIDMDCEKYGSYYFENEPFYILSMLRGLADVLTHNPIKIGTSAHTQADYEKFASLLLLNPPIHKNLGYLKDHKELDQFKFDSRVVNKGQFFIVGNSLKDEIGMRDLEERSAKQMRAESRLKGFSPKEKDYFVTHSTGFRFEWGNLKHCSLSSTEIVLDRIYGGLNQMMLQAKTPGKRLMSYIWAAREHEVCHLLRDGNGRSSIHALIGWIADDKELPLYIPENPNILDFQSPEKIIRDVHSGMVRLAVMSGKNAKDLIDVETLIEQADVKQKEWNEVHKRAELPIETIRKLVQINKER